MKKSWTIDQQNVIDKRGGNLLVAAAAGSGKTAVLVERVIAIITDMDHPVDIDRLLIVTFTNAAAAEMKERIGKAIEARLEEDSENEHLKRQSDLVLNAQITTIHSFCLHVIRNHIDSLDIDPAFTIADVGEMALLRADVMKDLMDECYLKGSDDFLTLIDCFAPGRSDKRIYEYVERLANLALSYPFPQEQLDLWSDEFNKNTLEEIDSLPWMKVHLTDLKQQIKDLEDVYTYALNLCMSTGGPVQYQDMLESDYQYVKMLNQAETYEDIYEVLSQVEFVRKTTKKVAGVDEQLKAEVSALRDYGKSILKEMKELALVYPPSSLPEDIKGCRPPLQALLKLTKQYLTNFSLAKREKGVVDFNDFEHLALSVLVKRIPIEEADKDNERPPAILNGYAADGWQICATEAADELSEFFEEIFIDEYQDSNLVQEILLASVSAERFSRANLFRVGDVKQSIYKFRLARPELFMDKYNTYPSYMKAADQTKVIQDLNGIKDKNDINDINGINDNDISGMDNINGINDISGMDDTKGINDINNYKDKNCYKIELKKNFRSRASVLDCINEICSQLMREELGGVEYDEAAALYLGADYYPDIDDIRQELYLIDESIQDDEENDSESANNKAKSKAKKSQTGEEKNHKNLNKESREIEAIAVARRIKELVDEERGQDIYDPITKQMRKAQYKDIVILLRAFSGWAEVFAEELTTREIPAFADSQTGYFNTVEVRTVLSLLSVIDNPLQDIPLAAVLLSPIGGLTSEALARITALYQSHRADKDKKELYLAVLHYIELGEEEDIKQKLGCFQEMLTTLRHQAVILPVHELLLQAMDLTGYYDYASAMPQGENRRMNLDMLVSKAVAYAQSSYHGLFNFMRYMESLKKYSIDFGEASLVGENDNVVRITTIHKSKGLEYPLVFICGLDKRLNQQDSRQSIILHPDFGPAADYIDAKRRIKSATLQKKIYSRQLMLETLGEELRILYVAMTRAKEHLIMTASVSSVGKKIEKNMPMLPDSKKIPYSQLLKANSYLDWILMATAGKTSLLNVVIKPAQDILFEETKQQYKHKMSKESLVSWDPSTVFDQRSKDEINKRLSFQYEHEKAVKLHTKMSVSELKRLSLDYQETADLIAAEPKQSQSTDTPDVTEPKQSQSAAAADVTEPKKSQSTVAADVTGLKKSQSTVAADVTGLKQSQSAVAADVTEPKQFQSAVVSDVNDKRQQPPSLTAAARGNAYHYVMQHLDFLRCDSEAAISHQIALMETAGQLSKEQRESINVKDLVTLFKSDLGLRLTNAARKGKLFRERQFIFGLPADTVKEGMPHDETILIQGVIDAYFEEEDGLVLVDYKTDKVAKNGEYILKDRYKEQLKYYQLALEQMMGRKVKKSVIYSFALGKECL